MNELQIESRLGPLPLFTSATHARPLSHTFPEKVPTRAFHQALVLRYVKGQFSCLQEHARQ